MNPIEYTKIRILSMGNSIDASVLEDLLVDLYNEGFDLGRDTYADEDESQGYGEQAELLEDYEEDYIYYEGDYL